MLPQDKKGNLIFALQTFVNVLYHSSFLHILTDSKEPLVPPRFLERFSNRKVKQGTSITLSVKVEGLCYFS